MRIACTKTETLAVFMFFALSLMSVFAPPAVYAGEIIDVQHPRDNEFVTRELGHLVAKVDVSLAPYISVKVNELTTPVVDMAQPAYAEVLGDMLIVRLYFAQGINNVEIVGKNAEGEEVAREGLEVFYRPAFDNSTSPVPAPFVPAPYHISEREDVCSGCHRMEVDNGLDMDPVKKTDIFCVRCHESGLIEGSDHGGTTWKCLYCHDPEGGAKYGLYDEKGAFCVNCHGAAVDAFMNMSTVHPKFREGDCLLCHGGHVAFEALLLSPVNKICYECHQSVYSGSHITPGHPLEAAKDPSREGKAMDCMSCHSAHASQRKSLMKFEGGMKMCSYCHAK